jgi:toxin YoeB
VRLVFTPHGWEDYTYWLAADRATLKRINRLIDDALRDPAAGIGKPEPLRHMLASAWSRRISEEHRLVYLVDGDDIVILQARFHYKYTHRPCHEDNHPANWARAWRSLHRTLRVPPRGRGEEKPTSYIRLYAWQQLAAGQPLRTDLGNLRAREPS